MLSTEELKRYNRHIILPEIGLEGQLKLKQASVLVIGAGGLGCPLLQYVAAAGVGTIGIVDFDAVSESNLQRQILFGTEDIGKSKAVVAKQKLESLNSFVKINAIAETLTPDNALYLFNQYDIIADCSDNFSTRYLVNDACVILNKPLVYGAINQFQGQLSVFNYNNGPTYRCLFPEPPEDSLNCAEAGVLGVLPGMIGSMQANEVIKIITGIGEPLSGNLFLFDALKMETMNLKFDLVSPNLEIKRLNKDYESCFASEFDISNVNTITVEELKKWIQNRNDFQLIDVREEFESDICNIGGKLIPLVHIMNGDPQIVKNKPVVIYCHHGMRSRGAIIQLQKEFGYKNLLNLEGGIHQWSIQIDQSIPTY